MAKNRITYAAILIMIIVFIGLYDSPAVYRALYAVLLMPLFSFLPSLFLLSAKKDIFISERLSSAAVKKGEKVRYYLTVENTGRRRFSRLHMKAVLRKDTRTVVEDYKTRIFSLPSQGKCEIEFEMSGKCRGIFNVGISDIWLYDTLGLFRFRKRINGGLILTVLPEAVPLEGLPIPQDNFAHSANDTNTNACLPEEDCAEICGLRDYVSGDGYKRIHWKLSAKKNKLISKTYRAISDRTIMLMIDNSRFPKSVGSAAADRCEDRLIEALVSVIAHYTEKQFNVSLYCMDEEIAVSSRNFEDLYISSANIKFNANGRFDDFFSGTVNKRRDVSSVLVFMREPTDSLCESVKDLIPECNVIVFYCPAGKYSDEKRFIDSLRTSGAVCCILTDKTNIADAIADCA